MNFANMKVRNKLVLSFGFVLFLFGAMIFLAILRMGTLNTANEEAISQDLARTRLTSAALDHAHGGTARLVRLTNALDAEQAKKLQAEVTANGVAFDDLIERLASRARSANERATLNQLRQSHNLTVPTIQFGIALDAKQVDNLKAEIDSSIKTFNEAIAKLPSQGDSEVESALLAELKQSAAQYTTSYHATLALVSAGKLEDAGKSLSGETSVALDQVIANLHKLNEHQRMKMEAASKSNRQTYESTRDAVLGLGAFAFVLFIATAVVITAQVARQLGGEPGFAVKVANKVAQGDLRVTIHLMKQDRSSVLYAIQTMRDSMESVVSRVRHGTDTIAAAAARLANGNLDLSSRTEQQASALEETASSMEQLTATVRQNADNARHANELAISASDVAIKGGAVVSQVVETMGSINDSAKKIVDIISVIDGIAFQTNILALNAAVEAARAGEQGRGFAVVASEVRSLAQRSAGAAKEIKALISASVEKVDAGSDLVGKAGATMEEVVASVGRVTDIMAEIMRASQEQSSGIEQVNQALGQMDRVTQQNASLVEEAAAAAAALKDQAGNLTQVVSIFQLSSKQAEVTTVAAAPTPVPAIESGRARPKRDKAAAIAAAPKPSTPKRALDVPQRKNLTHTGAPAGADWDEF